MTRRPYRKPGLPAGYIAAFAALHGSPPITDDERAAIKQQIADQRARDERGREPDLFQTIHVDPSDRGA